VPVDRPGPADDPDEPAHRQPPDGPQPHDGPGPADDARLPLDQARSEAVHRAHRTLVTKLHAADRDTAHDGSRAAAADADSTPWSEALPSLRAAWDEHEDRYPERERATAVTHMDGSWSFGETRRLTPDQNTEATKACADIHDEGERFALPALLQIEAADPNRHLVGTEHMLKGVDCLKEKIADALRARPGLTVTQALSIVPDPVRFSYEYSPDRYADGVRADVEQLNASAAPIPRPPNVTSLRPSNVE
jgi:hypothetical protein